MNTSFQKKKQLILNSLGKRRADGIKINETIDRICRHPFLLDGFHPMGLTEMMLDEFDPDDPKGVSMSRIISLFISQDGIRFLEKALEERKK